MVEKTSECGRFGAPFYLSADVHSYDDGIAFEGPHGSDDRSADRSTNDGTNDGANGGTN